MSSANLKVFSLKSMLLVLSIFLQNFVIIGHLSFFGTFAPHFGTFDRPQLAQMSHFINFSSCSQFFLYLNSFKRNLVKIGQHSFLALLYLILALLDQPRLALMN